MAKVIDVGAAVLSENDRLREENARLTRERDEARAEVKKYHDALVARHGGEPVALLEELDASKAEIERLEGLILDWHDKACERSNFFGVATDMMDEAQRIRAQRERG